MHQQAFWQLLCSSVHSHPFGVASKLPTLIIHSAKLGDGNGRSAQTRSMDLQERIESKLTKVKSNLLGAAPDADAGDTGAATGGAGADAGAAASVPLSSRARPVLTHCQVLGDDLIARMAALGVVANIQPSFVPTDARFVSQRLAASVHRTSYAWRSLLAAGVWCAGGSDAPVELPWPLLGMHDAMARAARPEGGGAAERAAAPAASDVFLPEERLPFAAALWLYTLGGAYAIGEEATLGALARGRRADFVVIGERGGDVTADPTGAALLLAQADETWVDGVRRYERAAADGAAAAGGGRGGAAMPTADPNSAGRHGPKRAPAAIGAGGCPCCFGQVFADALKRAKARRTI